MNQTFAVFAFLILLVAGLSFTSGYALASARIYKRNTTIQ